jgi:uncharacterized protein (TIGR02996 family)
MTLDTFLQSIIADPVNAGPVWLVLADWLEEQDDPRHEFVRLMHQPAYRPDLSPFQRDERVRELLASGMQPVVPTIENSIGMRFALIPAGTFRMGSPEHEGRHDEHPRHKVAITRAFWMGTHLVTQQNYLRVMGNNPSWFCSSGSGKEQVNKLNTKRFPVDQVSWEEAVAFCETLGKIPKEKKLGREYRLPTEVEWEYSCGGGALRHALTSFGKSFSTKQANFLDSEFERPCPVGSYPANPFGLFDMHGNVWEWCSDNYSLDYYKSSPRLDPRGPETGTERVVRGGSWGGDVWDCRSANRLGSQSDERSRYSGFRIVLLLTP